MAMKSTVPEFKPKNFKKVNENEIAEDDQDEDEKVIKEILESLKSVEISNKEKIQTIEFEKDDDTNFHIAAISAIANLRARNYKIPEVDNLKVKLIAGKIVPAIATTTATIVGAMGMEIIKLVQGKGLSTFKNAFINLALPSFLFTEPSPAITVKDKDYDPMMLGPVKAIPNGFTKWDSITIRGSLSIGGFLAKMKDTYGVEIYSIGCGKMRLYSTIGKAKDSLDISIEDKFLSTGEKFSLSRNFVILEICANDPEGIDALLPKIKYYIR